MPRFKATILILFGCLLLASGLFSFFLSKTVQPKQVEEKLVETIESMTEGDLSFKGFELSYFPRPGAKLKGAKLTFQKKTVPDFTADEIKISLQILPLLFRKTQIASVRLKGGRIQFASVHAPFVSDSATLEHLEMKIGALNSGRPVKLEFSSGFSGFEKAVSGKLSFTYDAQAPWRMLPSTLHGEVQLRQLALEKLKLPEIWRSQFQLSRGSLGGKIRFDRSNQDDTLELKGEFQVSNAAYQFHDGTNWVASPEISGAVSGAASINPKTNEINLKRFNFELPVGKLDANGRFFSETGEFRDVRISLLGIGLDKIPQYYVPIQQAIPVNIGFSGLSDLEMAFSGTLDHLSIHGQWDLTRALISYGGLFSKPKDIALNASFELLVKKGKSYSGDFTFKMRDAKFKGTLSDFEWQSGKGQINFITNKFPLTGWQDMIPPLSDYRLDGQVKILANLTGNYRVPETLKPMVNVTFDKVSILHRQNGTGIREMSMAVDYGIVALKVKDAVMTVENSPLQFSATVYNIESEPNAKMKMVSENLDLSRWLAALEDFAVERLSDDQLAKMQRIENFLKRAGLTREPLKNLRIEADYAKKNLTVPVLDFGVFDGDVKSQLQADFNQNPPSHTFQMEADRISLAKFFQPMKEMARLAQGNLFLQMKLAGQGFEEGVWTKTLQGGGVFTITNGEFQSFDVLNALGKSSELEKVSGAVTGKTAFNDLRSEFKIEDNKFKTDDLKIMSEAFQFQAKGDTTLDGILNYRAEIYLSQDLTAKVLGGIAKNFVNLQGKQLGPVPVLIAGPLTKPEVKVDPDLFPQFKERLLKQGSGEALRNFLPEEAFFERRSKS